METLGGFSIGDYVIADRAKYDSFEGTTFVVVGFTRNVFNAPLIRVRDIEHTEVHTTFFPHELSFEGE